MRNPDLAAKVVERHGLAAAIGERENRYIAEILVKRIPSRTGNRLCTRVAPEQDDKCGRNQARDMRFVSKMTMS